MESSVYYSHNAQLLVGVGIDSREKLAKKARYPVSDNSQIYRNVRVSVLLEDEKCLL